VVNLKKKVCPFYPNRPEKGIGTAVPGVQAIPAELLRNWY
jgi:hypothetical protein